MVLPPQLLNSKWAGRELMRATWLFLAGNNIDLAPILGAGARVNHAAVSQVLNEQQARPRC